MPWNDYTERFPHEPDVQRGMDLMGAALRRQRERLGWSQRDLQKRTGIDQSTISKFENGRRCGIRWPRFAKMVAVLGGLDFGSSTGPEPKRTKPISYRTMRDRIRVQEELSYQAAVEAARLDAEDDDDDAWPADDHKPMAAPMTGEPPR